MIGYYERNVKLLSGLALAGVSRLPRRAAQSRAKRYAEAAFSFFCNRFTLDNAGSRSMAARSVA